MCIRDRPCRGIVLETDPATDHQTIRPTSVSDRVLPRNKTFIAKWKRNNLRDFKLSQCDKARTVKYLDTILLLKQLGYYFTQTVAIIFSSSRRSSNKKYIHTKIFLNFFYKELFIIINRLKIGRYLKISIVPITYIGNQFNY